MPYESNDTQNILGVVPISDFTEIRVSEIIGENDELKSYDIRSWYCTRKDPNMKPSKGIRINKDNISDVISIIISNMPADLKQEVLKRIE